ncbi:19759_t:CDS:1, partial [Racocetra persica]
MRLKDRFEDFVVEIKNSMDKGVENENLDIINQGLRYLLIDWPLTVIFDPGGD